MRDYFEKGGYQVDDVKIGGRHGTIGQIYVTVPDVNKLSGITNHQGIRLIRKFAEPGFWYSFELYIHMNGKIKRKIIYTSLESGRIICDFAADGTYDCSN